MRAALGVGSLYECRVIRPAPYASAPNPKVGTEPSNMLSVGGDSSSQRVISASQSDVGLGALTMSSANRKLAFNLDLQIEFERLAEAVEPGEE
jgi:hypothetical protein